MKSYIKVVVSGRMVAYTDTVKYLGVYLDKGLTWKTHIWNNFINIFGPRD